MAPFLFYYERRKVMDIYNHTERQVICVSNKDNHFFDCDKNSPLLIVGEKYTVVGIDVWSFHTGVWLQEFPGIEFNSICFEEIE